MVLVWSKLADRDLFGVFKFCPDFSDRDSNWLFFFIIIIVTFQIIMVVDGNERASAVYNTNHRELHVSTLMGFWP